jgi:riboflavin synthase
MFTGIVADIGKVRRIDVEGDLRAVIDTGLEMSSVGLGASVACSGVCLTVVDRGDRWFSVQVSRETLDRTTLANWRGGTRVNLERSLRLGDELGGHLVYGHVDGLATVASIDAEGDSHRIVVEAPRDLSRYIAAKGSVALDGVSLTVNAVDGERFGVNIIPHTWTHTTFGERRTGDRLNLEVDMLARYVARLTRRE